MSKPVLRSLATAVFVACTFCAHAASAQSLEAPPPAESPAPLPTISAAPLPTMSPVPPPAAAPEQRRALPAPLDPVFPSVDFPGQAYLIGVPSDPGNRAYGWIDVGSEFSTSKYSNFPLSYNDVPNNVQLDQAVLRFDKEPDTVQQNHFDWGYRFTSLYGVDYRYTTMQGVLSNQLLLRNQTNGYDPVEAYLVGYFPRWGQGTTIQLGRFISPADIEANLAPQNFLYTHSIMFTFDCYTQMGALFTTMLSKQWTLVYGLHFDTDTAAWDGSAHFPTAEVFGRYVTPSNRNSVLFGVDAINDGQFRTYEKGTYIDAATGQVLPMTWGHDNLQQFNVTWTHVFNPGFQNQFETYYLYSLNAYTGGTINNYNVATDGPPYPGAGEGPGAFLPGLSTAVGMVDYLEYKYSPKGFLSLRLDYLNDPRGWRSGFPTSYGSLTLGTTYHVAPWFEVRPEIRTEGAFRPGITPYDNGTKGHQQTFGIDGIFFFGNP
jgi:Putative beta-barrel porin-2, OmpL-like. bbp2